MPPKYTLNSDCGEGYGIYKMPVSDETLMQHISIANVATGYHSGDPHTIRKVVEMAKKKNVAVGGHPAYPDVVGFGRREMKMSPEEVYEIVLYQVGALKGFLDAEGIKLNHIKPHGSLYGLTSRSIEHARAVCRVANLYGVPILGLADTAHEEAAKEMGVEIVYEVFADLEYENGKLVITATHPPVDIERAVKKMASALRNRELVQHDGSIHSKPVSPFDKPLSVCVHSDTPNAGELAPRLAKLIAQLNSPQE